MNISFHAICNNSYPEHLVEDRRLRETLSNLGGGIFPMTRSDVLLFLI